MKKARFLFTIIAFGVSTLVASPADEPSKQPSEQDSHENHAARLRPAEPMPGNQAPGKTNPADVKPPSPNEDGHAAVLPKEQSQSAARSSQAGPTAARPKSAAGNKPPQPSAISPLPTSATRGALAKAILPAALKTAAPAGKAGLTTGGVMVNKTGSPLAQPGRLPLGDATLPPGPSGVRGRGPAAALVGASLGVSPKYPAAAAHGADPKLKP
jgi:hypothetical protein